MSIVQIQTETKLTATCPKCKGHNFTVGHMIEKDNSWSWNCVNCYTNWQFTYKDKVLQMEEIPIRFLKGLALVKYAGNSVNEKLYFIIQVYFHYDKDGKLDVEWEDRKRYYIEEHTCPTNLVSCEAIIYNGDTDPHGVLEYVRAAPIAEICQKYGITADELLDTNNDYMFHYFHECGAEIDDERVGLAQGVTIDHENTTNQIQAPDSGF